MNIGMYVDISGEGGTKQQMRFSPPVAGTVEEAVDNSSKVVRSGELSQEAIEKMRVYLATEKPTRPYSTRQIMNHMSGEGYVVNTRDIEFVRELSDSE